MSTSPMRLVPIPALFLLLTLLSLCFSEGCYAPPLVYGPACNSPTSMIGSTNTTIIYEFSIIGDTNIACFANGMGSTLGGCLQKFGFNDIGLITDGTQVEVYWGANAATPGVYCKGMPLGTAFTWSWKHSEKKVPTIISNTCFDITKSHCSGDVLWSFQWDTESCTCIYPGGQQVCMKNWDCSWSQCTGLACNSCDSSALCYPAGYPVGCLNDGFMQCKTAPKFCN